MEQRKQVTSTGARIGNLIYGVVRSRTAVGGISSYDGRQAASSRLVFIDTNCDRRRGCDLELWRRRPLSFRQAP